MTLKDYKKAVTRLFFDMIIADGVVEDEEIVLLDSLKRKYGITEDEVACAHQITTAEAIQILKDWKLTEEKKSEYSGGKYTVENAFLSIDEISGCDNDRDINEAKLLAALYLCLFSEGRVPGIEAIPIKYRERKLRFARKEIIYLSSESVPAIDEAIRTSKKYIECLLAVYGYDFVYIPDVIDFLASKADTGLLQKILMFSKPLFLKQTEDTEEFVSKINSVTTETFTLDFIRDSGLAENLGPSLLVKLKTSTIQEQDDKGEWKPVKYSDFIAVPIWESVENTARLFTEKILEYSQEVTSVVRRRLDAKLYCKGIHQTLIDYTVDKSVNESVDSITLRLWGKKKGIVFNGLRNPFVSLQPKEMGCYMMILLLSIGRGAQGLPVYSSKSSLKELFFRLYNGRGDGVPDLYNALNVQISNIRKKLGKTLGHADFSRYSPVDADGYYVLKINPSFINVQDTENASDRKSLIEWIVGSGLDDMIEKVHR